MYYTGGMATMSAAEIREKLAEAIETAKTEAVFIERYGQPVGVLVSPKRYEELMEALEDWEDIEAVDAAIAEGGEPIPWEKVMIDLGWT